MGWKEEARRAMIASRPLGECIMLAGLTVLVPTLMLWLAGTGLQTKPFIAFFPPVLLAATFLGWRYATGVMLAFTVIGGRLFMPPDGGLDLKQVDTAAMVVFLAGSATMILIGNLLRESVIELDERARQSEKFNVELRHRTKNALQLMRALASRADRARDPAEFYQSLGGRLDALAKSNELLRFGVADSCAMSALVGAATAPFSGDHFQIQGPDCWVHKDATTPLMMALHELCTNALKYGSLTAPAGKVIIGWELAPTPEGKTILLTWTERGGPPCAPPQRKGLGSRLLVAHAGMLKVEQNFAAEGLVCRIRVKAASDRNR